MADRGALTRTLGEYNADLNVYGQAANQYNQSVGIYNTQLADYKKVLDSYNAASSRYNTQVVAPYNTAVNTYNTNYQRAVDQYNYEYNHLQKDIDQYNANLWASNRGDWDAFLRDVTNYHQANMAAQQAIMNRPKPTLTPYEQVDYYVANPGQFTAAKPEMTAVAPKDPGFTNQQIALLEGKRSVAEAERASDEKQGLIAKVQSKQEKPDSIIGGLLQNVRYST